METANPLILLKSRYRNYTFCIITIPCLLFSCHIKFFVYIVGTYYIEVDSMRSICCLI